MVDIEDIPAETRWEIAAKSATAMPFVFEIFFRREIGDKFDEIAQQIWIEGGKEAKNLAEDLGLPTKTAKDVSKAHGVISEVLFGPELSWSDVETTADRVIDRINGCPFLNRAVEMGLENERMFDFCKAYCESSVETLNPKYTLKYTMAMCKGDPYCETSTEIK